MPVAPRSQLPATTPTSLSNGVPSPLATNIASAPQRHDNSNPLWRGPCAPGPLGGVTQSMLVRFLSCRERFRLRYVLGLELPDKWNHKIGYGNMWHVCEEALAKSGDTRLWYDLLIKYAAQQAIRYPLQRDEIEKWFNVCAVQFPEYVKYWSEHQDVKNRTPYLQEFVFDEPYAIPSGRTVRLRGKFDSVDIIADEVTGLDSGVYLQENKTRGDIDKLQVERQLKFDLQTMLYLVALNNLWTETRSLARIKGVRYNVVRRPLSGGVGNISPHKAKATKTKVTPAETSSEFYERLRRDYIAADPNYWFFRVRAEISARDIQVFRDTCLNPILEQLCWWYNETTNQETYRDMAGSNGRYEYPPLNYRTPFGVWSALEEGGATEYDAYLESGSEAGLRRVETLFTELQ